MGIVSTIKNNNNTEPRSITSTIKKPNGKVIDHFERISGNFGNSKFDNFNDPVELIKNYNQVRAERQPWTHQATNATLGGIFGGLLQMGEVASYILDIPSNVKAMSDYFSSEETLNTVESNLIADSLKKAKEELYQKYLPIYKKNPNQLIDFNDSAFYWEAFRGVTESAVSFGGVGMGAGALVKGAGTLMRMKALQNYTTALARGVNTLGKGLQQGNLGRISAAYITNYGEGKLMALELYDNVIKNSMEDFVKRNPDATKEELLKFEHNVKINAGKQANSFMIRNKMFMFTDYLQLNKMFKATGVGPTRNLVKKPSMLEFLKSQASNAPKESLEEIGQNVLQMEGLYQSRKKLKEKGYNIKEDIHENMTLAERLIDFATSEQALLEGAMGMFGGPVQYTITQLPFENFEAQKEQYISQNSQFKKNEEYIDLLKNNIISSELAKEKADQDFKLDFEEEKENLKFAKLAIKNFHQGTTQNLEDQLVELAKVEKDESNLNKIESKIKLLNDLEQEYTQLNNKYNAASEIFGVEQEQQYYSSVLNKINESKTLLENDINNYINDYNEVSNSNYSLLTIDDKETSDQFRDSVSNLSSYQIYKELNESSKRLKKNLLSIFQYKDQLKNPNNNSVYERLNEVIESQMDIEDKIKQLKEGKKLLVGNEIKKQTQIRINQLEKAYNNTISNETIEKNGGVEKLTKDKKVNKIKDDLKKTPEKAVTNEAINQEDLKIDDDVESLSSKELSNLMMSGESLPSDELKKVVNDLKDNTSISSEMLEEARKIIQENSENIPTDEYKNAQDIVNTNNGIDNAKSDTFNSDELDNLMSSIQSDSSDESKQADVKLQFKDINNKIFNKFLNSKQNKEGIPVKYTISDTKKLPPDAKKALDLYNNNQIDQFVIDNLPIKVTINNNKNNFTFLFPVREGKNNTAANLERALRKKIITNLKNNKEAIGEIKYQYSGAFETDNTEKSLLEIPDYRNNEEIPLMYVNEDGFLTDVDSRQINSDFSTVFKFQDNIWAGVMFTSVLSPNGSQIPLKLNTRSLNDNELKLTIGLITNVLTIKEKNKSNVLKSKLKEFEDLYNLLNQEDKEYLGDNVTVGETLKHLLYMGDNSKKNPLTQLYFDKGQLQFGNNKISGQALKNPLNASKLELFLRKYKNRAVDIKKLQADDKYKKLLISSKAINTDVKIQENGEIFKSISLNTENKKNRYKTKAIYVKPFLVNKDLESEKKTTKLETKKEVIKKIIPNTKKVDIKDTVSELNKIQEEKKNKAEQFFKNCKNKKK